MTIKNGNFEGYIPDLLNKLATHPSCNCKFDLQLVADGKYGVKQDSGWNGMIGEVQREVRVTTVAYSSHILYSKANQSKSKTKTFFTKAQAIASMPIRVCFVQSSMSILQKSILASVIGP